MTAAAPTAEGLLTRERLGAFMRKYLIVFIFLGMCVCWRSSRPTTRS